MIDKSKQYKTRSGLPVEIYATDRGGKYPVHGAVFRDGVWISLSWLSDGKFMVQTLNDYDLIEIKPRIKRTYYINVHDAVVDFDVAIHYSRKDADKYAGPHRKACIKIPIDCEEGEGL